MNPPPIQSTAVTGGWILTWLVQEGRELAPRHQGCHCGRWMGQDMNTWCEREASLPDLSTGILNLFKSSGGCSDGPSPGPSLPRELGLTHVTKMG